MNEDLLAPPRVQVRMYARIVAAFGVAILIAGVAVAVFGSMTMGALAVRSAVVAAVLAAAVWAYAGLVRIGANARPERMPWIHAGTFAVGFGSLLVAVNTMLGRTILGRSLAENWWQVPAMFGMTLAAGGWGRRVGETLHCPRCEYEFRFEHQADAPIRCPECGTGWLGLLKKGRRVRSPRLMAGGIALAFTATIVMQPIFYMGWLAPHLPTSLVFASLYLRPKTWYTAWDELARRPLDAWSTRVMAERVLRQRRDDQYDSSPSTWFEATAAAGKIPPDLVERFYREGFEAALVVPDRVKVGKEFKAHLRIDRVASGSAQNLALMFGGYGVDDEAARHGRRQQTMWAHELRPDVFALHRDVLEQTLKVDHAGSVRVRAEFWVECQPSYMEQLAWQADGTPSRPANAVWFERIVTEKVVRVE